MWPLEYFLAFKLTLTYIKVKIFCMFYFWVEEGFNLGGFKSFKLFASVSYVF